jgi:hypothetical protein
MKPEKIISELLRTHKPYLCILIIIFAFGITTSAVHAETNTAPTATFDQKYITAFKTNPTITGYANHLTTPLHLEITASTSTHFLYFSKDISISSGNWSIVVYPPIPIGTYQMRLLTQGKVLDQASLVIGAMAPSITLDTSILPYDVSDGHLMRFSVYAPQSIGIAQLTFKIALNAVDLDTMTLYGFTDSGYTQAIATSTDGTLATTEFDATSSTAVLVPDSPIEIPTATTYYFDLDGVVTPTDTSYVVTTTLLGDSPIDMAKTISDIGSTTNIIWSPNSFGIASSTDPDWTNGGAIPSLIFGLTDQRYSTPTLACDLEADSNSVLKSTPVLLTWNSTGADKITWEDGAFTSATGAKTIIATTTHTYILNLSGSLGSTQCFTTVTVNNFIAPISTSSQSISTSTSSGSLATTTQSTTSTSTPSASFTATPITGKPSLTVTFKGSVNTTKSCSASTYTFAYGDNSTTTIAVAAKLCKAQTFTLTHAYTKLGTYTAQIYLGAFVKGTTTPTLIQSQKITVTNVVAELPTPLLADVSSAIKNIGSMFWSWLIHL